MLHASPSRSRVAAAMKGLLHPRGRRALELAMPPALAARGDCAETPTKRQLKWQPAGQGRLLNQRPCRQLQGKLHNLICRSSALGLCYRRSIAWVRRGHERGPSKTRRAQTVAIVCTNHFCAWCALFVTCTLCLDADQCPEARALAAGSFGWKLLCLSTSPQSEWLPKGMASLEDYQSFLEVRGAGLGHCLRARTSTWHPRRLRMAWTLAWRRRWPGIHTR